MGAKLQTLLDQLRQSPERVDEVLVTYRKKLHKAQQDVDSHRRGIAMTEATIERLEANMREYELMIELFDTLKEETK